MLSIYTCLIVLIISIVKSDLTIHHCSFTSSELAGGSGPNWYHEFTADECTNGLPDGNCIIGFKTTRPHCDARYAVYPNETRSVGPRANRVNVMGPAAIVHMPCEFGFDGGVESNLLYEMDFLCTDYGDGIDWRTLCSRTERPANEIDVTPDNLFTVQTTLREEDCDNGLPSGNLGECTQFGTDRLFAGEDFGQITFNSNDPRFPGMEFYVFRETNVPIARTTIGFVCNPDLLSNYLLNPISSDTSSDSSESSSSGSSDSNDPLNDVEWTSYVCSVPDGNAGDVLDGYTNGNEFGVDTIEYIYYKFKGSDCVDSNGNHKKPPNVNDDDVDCVVTIRSERDCGQIPIADLNTREAFNRGEKESLTNRPGPGLLYSRPKGEDCNNKETIMEVDYLCVEK